MNRETDPHAKEMYQLWTTTLKSKPSMDHSHTKIWRRIFNWHLQCIVFLSVYIIIIYIQHQYVMYIA